MNAIKVLTHATWTPYATTPMEGTTAHVKKDTLKIDIIAQVCFLTVYLNNNYSPKAKWIFTNIYEPKANNCFSIITLGIVEIPKKGKFNSSQLLLILQSAWLIFSIRVQPRCSRQCVAQRRFQLSLWNNFFDADILLKNKCKCGLSWSVLLSTSVRHYFFMNIFS